MKTKVIFFVLSTVLFQSCSTLNPTFKQLDPKYGDAARDGKLNGKTPKEIQNALGDPMSVGYMDKSERGSDLYYMMYPLGEGDISFLSFSTSADRRECLVIYFWKNDSFKVKSDQSSNSGARVNSCAFQNGKPIYDEALIEPIKKNDKK